MGGNGQLGWRGLTARWRLEDWAVPHLHVDNREEQLRRDTDCATQDSSAGKQSLRISAGKNLWGVAVVGETPSLTGEFVGETHRVLEHT